MYASKEVDEVKAIFRSLVGVAALSLVLVGTSTAHAASVSTANFGNVTCTGGVIAPGTYVSLRVTGNCAITDGLVTVNGGVTVAQNAVLFAASDTAMVIFRGNVFVARGGILVLGCSPDIGCATTTHYRVNGNVESNAALAVILHGNTIRGRVLISNGGGGLNCDPNPNLQGAPNYSVIEDNVINGNVSVFQLQSCWFGFIRNVTHGTVTLRNNSFFDPAAMEVVTNTIYGNLACSNNDPAPQVGDSGGNPNIVFGKKTGQCANIQ
ncbi:MAG: hypothetical protein OJF49_002052 [Ktedonobacterales bacterium]|jgi:hypothetical protein|nr:MAG: hypothetical protein OJF49_002052 [Ktedonobacterales bacterium]